MYKIYKYIGTSKETPDSEDPMIAEYIVSDNSDKILYFRFNEQKWIAGNFGQMKITDHNNLIVGNPLTEEELNNLLFLDGI